MSPFLWAPHTFRCSLSMSDWTGKSLYSFQVPNTHLPFLWDVSSLQISASLYFFLLSSHFSFFSSSDCFPGSFISFLMSVIISFIALIVLLIKASICCVCFSVSFAINSSVALACSSIKFALKFFAVSLFYLFSFAYSTGMKVLIFCHVFCSVGHCSHSQTAASNSPLALR